MIYVELIRIIQIDVIIELVVEALKYQFQSNCNHTNFRAFICELTHNIARSEFHKTLFKDIKVTSKNDTCTCIRIYGLGHIPIDRVRLTWKLEGNSAIVEAAPDSLCVMIIAEHGTQENITTRVEGYAQGIS